MSTIIVIVLLLLGLAFAALIYPGELSHLSPRMNRWLYDRAAAGYQDKWRSAEFQDAKPGNLIADFAQQACGGSGVNRVLDLGCGTGRGIQITNEALASNTHFTGVDFSGSMLAVCREWLESRHQSLDGRVTLVESDLVAWSEANTEPADYGLVMMLEVGEFLAEFATVLTRIAPQVAQNGGMILTRPAGLWWIFFPGRHQSRKAMSKLLVNAGFGEPEYVPWRSRYELVFVRKRPTG